MTEDEKHERALGLSPAQVIGSALAATSAALVASLAGTTGTIIGAGVGSIVATVGASVYTWWLRRTSESVKRRAAQVRLAALATQPLPRTVSQGPLRSRRKVGTATGEDLAPEEPALAQEADEVDEATPFTLPWRKVLLATLAVAVITFGVITTIEGLTGRPVSSLTGGSDSDGTSVGHFVGSDERAGDTPPQKEQTPPATDEPSPEPGSTDVPTPTPSSEPVPVPEPSTGPTDEPTAPAPSETAGETAAP